MSFKPKAPVANPNWGRRIPEVLKIKHFTALNNGEVTCPWGLGSTPSDRKILRTLESEALFHSAGCRPWLTTYTVKRLAIGNEQHIGGCIIGDASR